MWREVHVHSLRILVHRPKSELSQHVSTDDSGKKNLLLKVALSETFSKKHTGYMANRNNIKICKISWLNHSPRDRSRFNVLTMISMIYNFNKATSV